MIEIYNNPEAQAGVKKMIAQFIRDADNEVVIGDCTMGKGLTNRLSKGRQKEVKRYLTEHAGKEFDVSHNSTVELIFRDDGTKVRITFKQTK